MADLADHTDYDKDPGALAWARGKIEATAKRYEGFAERAAARGDTEEAARWGKTASAVRRDLIGQGHVIGSFDERLPALEAKVHGGAAALAELDARLAQHGDAPEGTPTERRSDG